jgi:hypothetical protein
MPRRPLHRFRHIERHVNGDCGRFLDKRMYQGRLSPTIEAFVETNDHILPYGFGQKHDRSRR